MVATAFPTLSVLVDVLMEELGSYNVHGYYSMELIKQQRINSMWENIRFARFLRRFS